MTGLAEACQLVGAALGRPPEAVAGNAAVGQAWDSLGHIAIVMALEEKIGRLLRPDEIGALRTLADIAAVLHSARLEPGGEPR